MFQKKSRPKQEIPAASLPDIIFLLLFFFMISTVIKKSQGIPIVIPAAHQTKKIEKSKRHLAYVWADDKNQISVDDRLISVSQINSISGIIREKLDEDNQLIVSLKIDKRAKMGLVSDIQEQLRDAYAVRINYSTRFK